MDAQQLEYVSNEIQALHRSIKNAMEMVFSVSPILALSTQGWSWRSLNSVYLLRVGRVWLGSFLVFINGGLDIQCPQ
jgi:hypothetical protein